MRRMDRIEGSAKQSDAHAACIWREHNPGSRDSRARGSEFRTHAGQKEPLPRASLADIRSPSAAVEPAKVNYGRVCPLPRMR